MGRVFGVNVVEKRVVGKRRGKARPGTQAVASTVQRRFPSLFWNTHPTYRQRPFAGWLAAMLTDNIVLGVEKQNILLASHLVLCFAGWVLLKNSHAVKTKLHPPRSTRYVLAIL